jgi:uncharacterized protein YktB (UPF0637 family)
MTTQILNIETATKSEIIIAASLEKDLMNFLGGVKMIKERSEETLKSLLNMYFVLNNEAGAFYDKNGF